MLKNIFILIPLILAAPLGIFVVMGSTKAIAIIFIIQLICYIVLAILDMLK